MKYLAIGFMLLITFVVAFFVATAFFDTLERHMGYYDQGIKDANEVGNEAYFKL